MVNQQQIGKMFNLINLPPNTSLLGVDNNGSGGLCSTPKTPEIVNTLIAMTTNPLDNYTFTTINQTNCNNIDIDINDNHQIIINHNNDNYTHLDLDFSNINNKDSISDNHQVSHLKL